MAHRRHHRHHYHRRRRNPDFAGLAVDALWGVAGGVATATLPAFLPGAWSSGAIGYVTSGAAAFVVSYGVSALFGAGPGRMALVGGLIGVAGKIIGDLTGKRFVTFSPLKGYGPLNYQLPSSTAGVSYQLPASGAVTTPGMGPGGSGMGVYRGRSKFAA